MSEVEKPIDGDWPLSFTKPGMKDSEKLVDLRLLSVGLTYSLRVMYPVLSDTLGI